MLRWRLKGGTASKIWIKTRKIVGSAVLILNCAQVFYTSRGGGSEAPIRRMGRWGLLANRHGTSLINFNFNPRVCFYDYFLRGLYGPLYVKQILKRG
jgi:hypothetical protein